MTLESCSCLLYDADVQPFSDSCVSCLTRASLFVLRLVVCILYFLLMVMSLVVGTSTVDCLERQKQPVMCRQYLKPNSLTRSRYRTFVSVSTEPGAIMLDY